MKTAIAQVAAFSLPAFLHQLMKARPAICLPCSFIPGWLNGLLAHFCQRQRFGHHARCLFHPFTGHQTNEIQAITVTALIAEPRSAPLFIIQAKTIRAATFRACAVAVACRYVDPQRRKNMRPAATCGRGYRCYRDRFHWLPSRSPQHMNS